MYKYDLNQDVKVLGECSDFIDNELDMNFTERLNASIEQWKTDLQIMQEKYEYFIQIRQAFEPEIEQLHVLLDFAEQRNFQGMEIAMEQMSRMDMTDANLRNKELVNLLDEEADEDDQPQKVLRLRLGR